MLESLNLALYDGLALGKSSNLLADALLCKWSEGQEW